VSKYLEAIHWIAINDDTDWLDDGVGCESVTLCLVADVFGKTREQATADLRYALQQRKAVTTSRQ
jgi:hypothetical protein